MALDRTEFIISEVREKTNTVVWDDMSGVHDNEILGYLNDAQAYMQEFISNRGFIVFENTVEIPIVANQEFYALPEDAFANNRIRQVSYSRTRRADDWGNLRATVIQNRDTTSSSYPDNYIAGNGGIYLVGVPRHSQGFLRIMYERALDSLDTRRGKVDMAAVNSGVLTTISFFSDEWLKETEIQKADFFCVNDLDGNVKLYNVRILSYDLGLHAVAVSLPNPEYIPQTGDYITLGKYSTTHSKLPRNCRKYLSAYAQVAVQDRDTLDVPVSQNTRLIAMESSLINTYSLLDKNVMDFAVDDYWTS